MLKKIIALTVAAAFGGAALAQTAAAPAAPAKPAVEAAKAATPAAPAVNPAQVTPENPLGQ